METNTEAHNVGIRMLTLDSHSITRELFRQLIYVNSIFSDERKQWFAGTVWGRVKGREQHYYVVEIGGKLCKSLVIAEGNSSDSCQNRATTEALLAGIPQLFLV
jgi:hypothetical protein